MIAPLFAAQIRLWPVMYELGDNLANNLAQWEELWVKETCPPEEEQQKIRIRVGKVRENLQDAKLRGGKICMHW